MKPGHPTRAAIVGAGLMGRWHARALEHAGGVVSAVIDPDPARASTLAAEHGARIAPSIGDAAAGGAVDVAHICTPLPTHGALVRDAIALGLHALVEKPLVPTATETAELIRLAAKHDVQICPVHQFPFQRGVRDIVDALPRIGPVLHVQTIACSAGADGGDAAVRDQVAGDILPHALSLFSALGLSVADVAWEARRPMAGEIVAVGQTGGGATTVSVLVSMSGRPTSNTLHVIGAHGTAHADLFHGFATIETGGVSRAKKILHPFALSGATLANAFSNLVRRVVSRESAYPGLRELVAAFYASVRGAAPAPIPVTEMLAIAQARDILLADPPSRGQRSEQRGDSRRMTIA